MFRHTAVIYQKWGGG